MPKYIVYKNTLNGVKYLTHIVNKRPYFTTTRAAAQVCENKELAEFVAKQAYNYSGDNWKVQEVNTMPTELISKDEVVKALEDYAQSVYGTGEAYSVFRCLRIVRNIPAYGKE